MSVTNKLPKIHVFQESDSDTCGPCCLAMVYALKEKNISLEDILRDFKQGKKGEPTFGGQLSSHLKKNGIKVKITVSTSRLLLPSWKNLSNKELAENIQARLKVSEKTAGIEARNI